jgi:hypothetical protein
MKTILLTFIPAYTGKRSARDEMGEVRPDPDIDVETQQKAGENFHKTFLMT